MSYTLRYYKEITQKDGSVFRLEIHKKDSTASAVEIGAVVQGLSLEIQGQQGDIDTPIVKTSLSMTFVDAGDVEDGRKNGFWEEFYTPDALLWKVILKAKNATENTFRTVWGGYVTPDSYSESLVYRGSVNIIARDNIGHMQDFPFDASGDADGMISLYNLVNAGWEKIASPMSLSWGGEWLYCDGVPAYDTLMNVSAFEDRNWYEAIESVLASYGLVMRYIGDNVVQISSLRYMPYQGKESMDLLPRVEPKFIAGAQRDLIPAVRRIEESVSYDLASELQPLITSDDYSGETYQVIDASGEYLPFLAFDLANKNIGGWSAVTDNGSFFVDLSQYYFHSNVSDSDEEQIKKETYLIANVAQTLYQVEYTKAVNAGDMQIGLTFGRPIGAWREYDSNGIPLGNWFPGYSNGRVTSVVYGVAVTQNGITSYLQEDGEWGEEKAELVHDEDGLANLAIPVGLSEFTGVVDVTLFLYSVKATCAAIQLAALEFSPSENISYRAKNNVNTVYNSENNVILSRTPDFGPAFDRVTLPAFIKNGIFYRYGDAVLPARAWAWSDGTPQQMAVYNHLQLLCYYAKPNNQITGTIVNADLTRARAIYEWHGKEHLLVSGRYDFLTGFIEGAVLREFIRYDDMWGEVSEALLPDTEENSKSNIEAGAGSSGSSSTYTNTTTVNIGSGGGGGGASYLNDLLDVNTESVIAKSVLYYDGNTWIDKSIATILDEVLQSAKTIAGWFKKDDNGDIYTDVNFYSLKTVASGGKGKEGEGSGSGVVVLEDWGKYDATLPQVLGAALGLELHNRLTAVEKGQVDIDLSGYATIDYVTQAIDDLVNGAPAALDTLKEIAEVLQGNVNSIADILTAIETKANKTEVDALKAVDNEIRAVLYEIDADIEALQKKDSEINTSLTGINDKITAIKEITDLFHIDDEGNIYVDENFYSKKTVASGGKGVAGTGGGTGTVMAVSVNGTTYDSVDGIVTIPDYPTKVSQLANDRSYATTVQLTTDLMSKQDRITSDNPLSAELISGLGELAFKDVADLSSDYLPKTGGTISIDSYKGITIKRNASSAGPALWFSNYLGDLGAIGVDVNKNLVFNNGTTDYDILHSGNVGEYAYTTTAKLLTASDNLDSCLRGVYTYVNANNPTNAFGDNSVVLAFKSAHRNTAFQLASEGNQPGNMAYRHRNTDGGWSAWKTIAFTDSDITGNAGSADVIAKTYYNENINYARNESKIRLIATGDGGSSVNYPTTYCSGISVLTSYTGWQMVTYGLIMKPNPYFRAVGDNGTWSEWKRLAFLDDNVASAYKLIASSGADALLAETGALTIPNAWQMRSVNGAGNGYVTMLLVNSANDIVYGYGGNKAYHRASSYNFTVGTASTTAMNINSSGNVTIGGSDLATTNYKLHVAGNAYASSLKTASLCFESDSDGNYDPIRSGEINRYEGSIHLQYDSPNDITMCKGGGNVGIGTPSPAYKLDVAGQGHFAGAVTIDGTITSKVGIELFAATPYIDFHFGDSTGDYTARIAELESGSLFCYGNWIPNSDNTRSLGASWSRWKNIYGLNGFFPTSLTAGDTNINGNLVVSGDTSHTGWVYFANGTTYYVNAGGAAKFASLTTGAITASTITASGLITANAGLTIPTGQKLTIGGATLEWDGSALKITGNAYATGTLASGGKGTAGAGNSGALLADWADLPSDTASQKLMSLSAYLGNSLRSELAGKLSTTGNAASATRLAGDTSYTAWGRTFFSNGKPVNITSSPVVNNNGGLYIKDSEGNNRLAVYYASDDVMYLGSGSAQAGDITRVCGRQVLVVAGTNPYGDYMASFTSSGLVLSSGKTLTIGDVTLSASGGKLYANGVAIN